jgi:hypothetical protein
MRTFTLTVLIVALFAAAGCTTVTKSVNGAATEVDRAFTS